MQYLVAVAWIAYIIHGLRRAYAEHCLARRLRQLAQGLARIGAGMTPGEVRALLGPPCRVTPSPEGVTWQYRVDGTFHTIAFVRGGAEVPPMPPADEPPEDGRAIWAEDDWWEDEALTCLRRAS